MARMAQGPNAGDILPCDLQPLAHNPFGHLVFAVGLTHAEAVLRFPRTEPVRRQLWVRQYFLWQLAMVDQ